MDLALSVFKPLFFMKKLLFYLVQKSMCFIKVACKPGQEYQRLVLSVGGIWMEVDELIIFFLM